jgi:esterase/lipase
VEWSQKQRRELNQRGAIILFHGLTSSPEELSSLTGVLREHRFEVSAPHLAGHTDIELLRRTHLEVWLEDAVGTLASISADTRPLFVGGSSFGALLALYIATLQRWPINGLVLLAPPLRLRRRFDEARLRILAQLPETIIDRLGTRAKNRGREGRLALPRSCLEAHSVASIVRLVKLRELIMPKLAELGIPILIVQDPHDHLVHPDGVDPFIEAAEHTEVDTVWLPGAEHELTLGPRHTEVSHTVSEFLNRLCLAK